MGRSSNHKVQGVPNILIALFGIDGSGKSTLARKLLLRLEEAGCSVNHRHWRPRILPPRGAASGDCVKVKENRARGRSFLLSNVVLIFTFLDFFLWAFLHLNERKRHYDFVLHERYFYDVLFDPRRYRLNIWFPLARTLAFLLPPPELIIHLTGDALEVSKRKSEISPAQAEKLQKQMRLLLPEYAPVLEIDTTVVDAEGVVDDAFKTLSRLMNESC